ncbi:cytoplasmic protein [Polynucleobacter sp. UK-Gri1-W3]|uniref:cytoplasmic protein n=1 Tax=Polynucleobacter sp. UK-Gri1-W3 TaxID=1819737 RepID=UPI001C0DFE1B|nr:cytoplasmic protein [Polynucleobacter sp. UK-Gri1-W3]MBU3537649.1 cytoplasmic protein [Polynucleobacter sp. UK-Gri1-W3]
MNNYSDVELETAHKHSLANRKTIQKSEQCSCFYCCCVFPATMVEQWLSEANGQGDTGWCPRCGVDSLIGDASGIPLTPSFLAAMNGKYFDADCAIEADELKPTSLHSS